MVCQGRQSESHVVRDHIQGHRRIHALGVEVYLATRLKGHGSNDRAMSTGKRCAWHLILVAPVEGEEITTEKEP